LINALRRRKDDAIPRSNTTAKRRDAHADPTPIKHLTTKKTTWRHKRPRTRLTRRLLTANLTAKTNTATRRTNRRANRRATGSHPNPRPRRKKRLRRKRRHCVRMHPLRRSTARSTTPISTWRGDRNGQRLLRAEGKTAPGRRISRKMGRSRRKINRCRVKAKAPLRYDSIWTWTSTLI
ncbi:hypothetical protein CT0861_01797, partial [Colletotrichum tofieldiae]